MITSIRTVLILILVLFLVCSCNGQSNQENSNENMRELKSYLALGDSYTIGESIYENERWPILLVKELNGEGYNIESVKIIAKTGWTTDELIVAIEKEAIKDNFDMVSLCIGVNNQYRGRDIENYRVEFAYLLKMAIKFTGNNAENVFVLSIPDWGKTPFAKHRDIEKIEQEIELYNKVKKEECMKAGVAFIEITHLTQNIEGDSTLLAKDGLHYSGKMHKLWVDEVIKQLFDN